MVEALQILPGPGRGTMRSMVEGLRRRWSSPSVSPSASHLPVSGRS
jgi:hypothetical protein